MRGKILASILLLSISHAYAFATNVKIEISNIAVSSGKLYIAVYHSEKTFKKTPYKNYKLNSDKSAVTITDQWPEGDYVVTVYQDKNDNNKLDTNFLGIPKEPVGISNYSGKGIPGGFDELKVHVSENNQILRVNMVQIL